MPRAASRMAVAAKPVSSESVKRRGERAPSRRVELATGDVERARAVDAERDGVGESHRPKSAAEYTK